MEHSDFSSDISSDDFIDEDEHHEHEQKIKYIKQYAIALGMIRTYKKWYMLKSLPKVHIKTGLNIRKKYLNFFKKLLTKIVWGYIMNIELRKREINKLSILNQEEILKIFIKVLDKIKIKRYS